MGDKPNPFDKGPTESDLIQSAYQDVKSAKFDFSLVPEALVKSLRRDAAKRLYYEEPSNSSDFAKEVLPCLVLASSVIEEKSGEILIQELIKNSKSDENLVVGEIEQWSQGKKEDWLAQLDIIDQDLKEKMCAVRITRNRLVHDPDKFDSLDEIEYDSKDLPGIVDDAVECVEELNSKADRFNFTQ